MSPLRQDCTVVICALLQASLVRPRTQSPLDTHNTRPNLPAGDVLIHAGDLTCKESFRELQFKLGRLIAQPHKYKIVIAGNHELLLDAAFVDQFPERVFERPLPIRDVWSNTLGQTY